MYGRDYLAHTRATALLAAVQALLDAEDDDVLAVLRSRTAESQSEKVVRFQSQQADVSRFLTDVSRQSTQRAMANAVGNPGGWLGFQGITTPFPN